ncbi:glycosyltransferase family 9 protein [Fusobacterium perfoetens]|uniref:glycosyltransferase family 9 protein n=1 Tax=Fusobacterium perfoetens TaxID=852 RepID=UPI00048592C0|nr:glycosyltransferase family 9 protein [Fusobacterium perfoetens]
MRILIIRLSSIGDIILTTPILKQLKEKYPNITIDFLVLKNFKDSIEGSPYIDNLILFDKKINDGYKNIKELAKKLNKNNYDYVFDLHRKFRSKLISNGIKAKTFTYPKRKIWKTLLVRLKVIKYHVDDSIIKNYFKAFKVLDLKYKFEDLHFPFTKQDLERVKEFGGLFAIAPGASKETKKWLPENFGKLAKKLYAKYNIKTVLLGGKEDIERCNLINNISDNSCINLAGKLSLKESGALLSISKLLITNDSGPFHIGRGVGCKTFVIFGPTDPNMFQFNKDTTLIYSNEKCAPCSLHGEKQCPKKHFNCMNNIKVDYVFNLINKDLNKEEL